MLRTPRSMHAGFARALVVTSMLACGRTGLGNDFDPGVTANDGSTDGEATNVAPCPSSDDLSMNGQPCSLAGLACEWELEPVPLCNGGLVCMPDGHWLDDRNGLPCPHAHDCPAAPPSGTCDLLEPAICSYADAGVVCVCTHCGSGKTSDTWSCFRPEAGCLERPRLGSACAAGSPKCRYPPSPCCLAFEEECSRGVWLGHVLATCAP